MDLERFDRQLLLFGEAGQQKIAESYATIVGNGGTGSHMAQQLTFLGVRKYDFGLAAKENQVGQVTGLAWTEVGGDLLTMRAVAAKLGLALLRTGLKRYKDEAKPRQGRAAFRSQDGTAPYLTRAHGSPLPTLR